MPIEVLQPNGDGTVTGWAEGPVAVTTLFDSIDDYTLGGPKDDDLSYIFGPNNADGSAFFNLVDTSASFDPTKLASVTCKIAYRKESAGVSGTADTIALSVQIVQSDNSTALTNLVSVSTDVGTTYVETTVTLTAPNTAASKATWDAGRLRIFQDYTIQGCADTTTRLRVTAAQVTVTWVPAVAGSQATETDSANAGALRAAPAGAQATETDTANAGAPRVVRPGSQVTETDIANAGMSVITKPGSQASETDTAQAGAPRAAVAGTQATESDTANAGAPSARIVGAQAAEVDTPFAGTVAVVIPGAQATETDTANSGTPAVTLAGSQATESDTAASGTPSVSVPGAQALEADNANLGDPTVLLTGGQALEQDTANSGSPTTTIVGSQAVETDTAFAGAAVSTPGVVVPPSTTPQGGGAGVRHVTYQAPTPLAKFGRVHTATISRGRAAGISSRAATVVGLAKSNATAEGRKAAAGSASGVARIKIRTARGHAARATRAAGVLTARGAATGRRHAQASLSGSTTTVARTAGYADPWAQRRADEDLILLLAD